MRLKPRLAVYLHLLMAFIEAKYYNFAVFGMGLFCSITERHSAPPSELVGCPRYPQTFQVLSK